VVPFARFVTACLMGTKSVLATVTVVAGRLVLGDTGIPGTAVTKVTARAAAVANSTVAAAIPRRRSAAPAPSPTSFCRVGPQVSYRDQRKFGLAGAQLGGDGSRR